MEGKSSARASHSHQTAASTPTRHSTRTTLTEPAQRPKNPSPAKGGATHLVGQPQLWHVGLLHPLQRIPWGLHRGAVHTSQQPQEGGGRVKHSQDLLVRAADQAVGSPWGAWEAQGRHVVPVHLSTPDLVPGASCACRPQLGALHPCSREPNRASGLWVRVRQ